MRIGEAWVQDISDRAFVARPSYFSSSAGPTARPDFFDRDQAAWLRLGCFLVRVQDRVVLVDAGRGPRCNGWPTPCSWSGASC